MNKNYIENIKNELNNYIKGFNYNNLPVDYEIYYRKYTKSFYFIFNCLIFEFLENENKEIKSEDLTEIKALLNDYLIYNNECLLYYASTLQILLNKNGYLLYRVKIENNNITLFYTDKDKYKENKKDYWTKLKNVTFNDRSKRLLSDYIESKKIAKTRYIYF